jgi:hypothetical protein
MNDTDAVDVVAPDVFHKTNVMPDVAKLSK